MRSSLRPMRTADVAVVGAGPAGSAAAATLAHAGRRVVLVDKARFPRDKACGDGLTTGALRLLDDLGLDPGQVGSWMPVDDVVVRSPSGHEVTFPLPRHQGTYAAIARRVDLDAAVLDLARKAGADVCEGHEVVGARAVVGSGGARHRRTGRGARPVRGGRRWHVVTDAQVPRRLCTRLPRRVARLPPVLRARGRPGRPRAAGLVRAGPPARLRLVVPAAGWGGQRRLRHPAGPRHHHP